MTEQEFDIQKQQADIQEHLAKIRKTIADSRAVIAKAELRMQETDRLLAAKGLTREQVLGFQFSAEQRELVNRELERRGLQPFDFSDDPGSAPDGFDGATDHIREMALADGEMADRPTEAHVDLDERASKFRLMMNAYRVS